MKYRIFFFLTIIWSSCVKDVGKRSFTSTGFPDDVGRIIIDKCGTSGCHSEASKGAAAGLSLASWESMFAGSNSGAVVIPFRPDQSTLFMYTNTFSDFGIQQLSPRMPLNSSSLSREEMNVLWNWIYAGAKNAKDLVKFADTPNRQKIYVANQGCDEVTIIDAASLLPMRYVEVGIRLGNEKPHDIKITPDGKFWCVIYLHERFFHIYNTSNDKLHREIYFGPGSWSGLTFSGDSRTAFVIDQDSMGQIARADLFNGTVSINKGFSGAHSAAINKSDDTLYITSQTGNFLYKVPVNNPDKFKKISVDGRPPLTENSMLLHDVAFSPDFSQYFVTCERTNELKVIQTNGDKVHATIPVGHGPQEIVVCQDLPLLLISCPDDAVTFPGKTGAVYVVNYETNVVVARIYAGHQPHGLAIDEQKRVVFVTNRNIAEGGPLPHHGASCEGQNGYLTMIDLTTLTINEDFKLELSVDPYAAAIRQ